MSDREILAQGVEEEGGHGDDQSKLDTIAKRIAEGDVEDKEEILKAIRGAKDDRAAYDKATSEVELTRPSRCAFSLRYPDAPTQDGPAFIDLKCAFREEDGFFHLVVKDAANPQFLFELSCFLKEQ